MRSQTIYSFVQAALSLAGTADAGTLYWAHKNNVVLPCTSGDGCDLVYASHWSHIGSVPLALLGACAYIALLFLSVLKLTAPVQGTSHPRLTWAILLIAAAGCGYSWYLQYVAAVDIGAFCIYCRASAIIMSTVFLSSVVEAIACKHAV